MVSQSDLARRMEKEKRRRLERLAARVNDENEGRTRGESTTGSEVFTDSESVNPLDSAKKGGSKRKDRSSVSSGRGLTKRAPAVGGATPASSSPGTGSVPRSSGAAKMPTSRIFPKKDWPPGYSAQQVDQLTPELVVKLKEMRQKDDVKGGEKSLPGYKMFDAEVVIPIEFVDGGEDDSTNLFCPGRWRRFPVGPIRKWWKFVPLQWSVIVPEFGYEERGMNNRIPRETWEGAHDRTRWWELKFWGSVNANNYMRERDTKVKLLEGGEVL